MLIHWLPASPCHQLNSYLQYQSYLCLYLGEFGQSAPIHYSGRVWHSNEFHFLTIQHVLGPDVSIKNFACWIIRGFNIDRIVIPGKIPKMWCENKTAVIQTRSDYETCYMTKDNTKWSPFCREHVAFLSIYIHFYYFYWYHITVPIILDNERFNRFQSTKIHIALSITTCWICFVEYHLT